MDKPRFRPSVDCALEDNFREIRDKQEERHAHHEKKQVIGRPGLRVDEDKHWEVENVEPVGERREHHEWSEGPGEAAPTCAAPEASDHDDCCGRGKAANINQRKEAKFPFGAGHI